MEILEVIDRPIRPLVEVLNRIGLATKWSCCGFSYKDEQEKKSHANYPFVVLRPIQLQNVLSVANFFKLSLAACHFGWHLMPYSGNGEWHLSFQGAQDQKFYRDDPNGIHNYETKLIRIQGLQKELEKYTVVNTDVEIVDGNTGYAEATNGEWQIKPHPVSILKSI